MVGMHIDRPPASYRTPKVEREVPTKDQERRADIVVVWRGGQRTHIEVKVGDEKFDKTFETCRKLRADTPTSEWYYSILIPDASSAAWGAVARAHAGEDTIDVILWDDVVRCLRQCLWERCEPLVWRAWAWAFCGAIEARLLGLRSPDRTRSDINELEMASRWVGVLTTGEGVKSRCRRKVMSVNVKSFLQEGVELYSEARTTLAAFDGEIEKLLWAAVQGRQQWSPLKNQRIQKPKSDGGRGDIGWWVATLIRGTSPRGEEVDIECGLWWSAPGMRKPMIFASFYKEPKRVLQFQWPKGKQGIESFTLWDKTYLYLPVPKPVEIEGPLNSLLDALLTQLDSPASLDGPALVGGTDKEQTDPPVKVR